MQRKERIDRLVSAHATRLSERLVAHRTQLFAQCLVARDRACGDGLPGFRVPAGLHDRVSPAFGDGVMALACIAGAVGCDAGTILVGPDLVE